MKINKNIIISLIIVIFLTLAFSACTGENSTVNIAVYGADDALSLFLTGTVKGYIGKTSNYLFLSSGIDETYEKLQKADLRKAVNIAYIRGDELGYIIKGNGLPLKVVFIDCYQDGQIKGLWVAREDWMQASPNSFNSIIEGLAKSADFRARYYTKNMAEAKAELKGEYQIKDFNDVGYYLASYALDNDEEIAEISFESKSAKETLVFFEGYAQGLGAGYTACLELYEQADGQIQGEKYAFADIFKLDVMLAKTEDIASK